jgi:peptidoglycan/LPS O-acetylase OafA/YrhL
MAVLAFVNMLLLFILFVITGQFRKKNRTAKSNRAALIGFLSFSIFAFVISGLYLAGKVNLISQIVYYMNILLSIALLFWCAKLIKTYFRTRDNNHIS